MRSIAKFAVTVLPILLLLLSGSPALADAPVSVTHEVTERTVEWTMSPECDSVPDHPLSGTGSGHTVTVTRVYADGTTVIQINDVAKGSASDSTGTYRWQYNNEMTETAPAGGGAHEIHMMDSFELNGDGAARLSVGFNWRYTYTPPAEFWPPVDNFEEVSTRGDPWHCDPL